jgi:hypothetical protein
MLAADYGNGRVGALVAKLSGSVHMSVPSAENESTQSSSGYSDGLGRRVLGFDRETGGILERLVLRPELAAFELALSQRLAIVAALEDERFARPRAIERQEDRLTVVSEYLAGRRLSDIIECAAEHGIVAGLDASLGLLLELLPALARLHDAGLAHGALAPGRLMITPAGQIVLLDAIYAEPLERLQLTRKRLWAEFRLAFPPTAGLARFDKAADLAHASMVAATLTVGRPLQDKDYPEGISVLRQEIHEIASIRGSKSFADAVDKFFAATLPVAGRRTTPSADEAAIDLRKLVRKELGINTCRTTMLEFFQQVETADHERSIVERAEHDQRLAQARAAAAERTRAEAERKQWQEPEPPRPDVAAQARLEAERAESARAEAERSARDQAKQERARVEAERAERERIEAERREHERAEAERVERERAEHARIETERVARERAEQARREAERSERERLEAERRARERLEAERLEQERIEKARLEAERIERERLEAERRERERLEAERLERERLEQARLEAERIERERLEAERRERERLEAERLEKERIEKARLEAERLERERLEAERRERERLEAERLERERIERARLEAERLERERLEAERRERERLEAERLEKERIEKARLEAERIERERIEAERRERERLEAERLERERIERARLEAERLERERAEKARLEAERIERERIARERAEKVRIEAERRERERLEAERLERERAEKARLEAEQLERERHEAERVAQEARHKAERLERERLERERLEAAQQAEQAKIEAARLERERLAREQQEADRLEAERLANEDRVSDDGDGEETAEAETVPEPARQPPAPTRSGWLIPPNRAASFEPVPEPPAPPAPAPVARPYPIYVAPADPPAWSGGTPPADDREQFLAMLSAPRPVSPLPISLAPAPAPPSIRLKGDDERAPAPSRAESRREPVEAPLSAAEAYEPFRSLQETRSIPWKMIAGGVAVLVVVLAVYYGYAPSPAPVVDTVRKAIPKGDSTELPPVAADVGRLIITTQPAGARVTLDGKPAGETPLTIDAVKPGRHVLAISGPEGSARRTVRVEAGQVLTVDVPLFSGFVAISIPFVVNVSTGGKVIGTSENPIILGPGRHALRLVNKELGYNATETVEITAGETTRLDLDPKGTANINAAPWAEVWIDGERAGDTPLANVAIRLGVREFVFKNPQFPDRKQTVTITGSAAATISVDFNK